MEGVHPKLPTYELPELVNKRKSQKTEDIGYVSTKKCENLISDFFKILA